MIHENKSQTVLILNVSPTIKLLIVPHTDPNPFSIDMLHDLYKTQEILFDNFYIHIYEILCKLNIFF